MDDLAFRIAGIAESEYGRIADILAHDMSHVIGLRVAPSNRLFTLNPLSGYVIPFNGSYAEIKRRLSNHIALSFQNDILQGAPGLRELSSRHRIPGWIRGSMARYISDGSGVMEIFPATGEDSPTADPYSAVSFNDEMELHGRDFFHFLDLRFGTRSMGDLLRELGEIGAIEGALSSVTGMNMERLAREWKKFYTSRRAEPVIEETVPIVDLPVHIDRHDKEGGALAISPDGSRIAVLERGSVYPVFRIFDSSTGNTEKTIGISKSWLQPGHHVVIPSENNLSWDPLGVMLFFAASDTRGTAIYAIDTRSGRTVEIITLPFSVVLHPSLSPDGTRIVFSAVGSSSSDLYIVDRKNRSLQRLTDDAFYECHPTFTPDGEKILYSTNRNDQVDYGKAECSIFMRNLLTGKDIRLVSSGGSDINASISPDGGSILYSSERSGRSVVCRYRVANGKIHYLNVPGSPVLRPIWFPDGKRFACFTLKSMGWRLLIGTVPE